MKKSSFFSLFVGLMLISHSCFSPEEDPVNPLLLKYTENGENVASALINGSLWKSIPYIEGMWSWNNNYPYLDIYPEKDSFLIVFMGKESVVFSFKGLGVNDFKDFQKLSDKKITLGSDNHKAFVGEFNSGQNNIKNGTKGQIYFKNVNFENDTILIISGGFGFKQPLENRTVSYGRFDYVIPRKLFDEAKTHPHPPYRN